MNTLRTIDELAFWGNIKYAVLAAAARNGVLKTHSKDKTLSTRQAVQEFMEAGGYKTIVLYPDHKFTYKVPHMASMIETRNPGSKVAVRYVASGQSGGCRSLIITMNRDTLSLPDVFSGISSEQILSRVVKDGKKYIKIKLVK